MERLLRVGAPYASGDGRGKSSGSARRAVCGASDALSRQFRRESAELLLPLHVALVRDVASQPWRPEWLAGDRLGQRFGAR